MVSPEHLNDRFALHGAVEHRSVEERLAEVDKRLAECERLLGVHGGRLDGLDAGLAAHVDEPVEVVYTEIEESPGAEVDIAEAENAASADIAESESGEAEAGE